MFDNPIKPDFRQDEGTVMQTDLIRGVCKVITMRGQKLDNVMWVQPYGGNERHGDRVTPRMGDRVLLSYGLGYAVIMGFLPRPQLGQQSFPVAIDSGAALVDTGTYVPTMSQLSADASTPPDMVLGDRIVTSQGGGMLGMLRAGSVVLRSSKAAELFMSRLGDLVRVMSRNFEHFTDLGTDVIRNFRGRVYRYLGVGQAYTGTRDGEFTYHQYYGDTAAAESVKDNYHNPPATVPTANTTVFKEQVTTPAGTEYMRRTLDLDGTEEVVIHRDGVLTRVKSTNDTITLSYNDQHTITIDPTRINLHHNGGADVLLDSSGVHSTFSGHFCHITSSGVQLG